VRRRALPSFAFVFGSGACALVYQVAWFRELRLVFGASTAASAAVLAVFMAGLGLGGLYLGPAADRAPRPLALYGKLELGVAALSALSPFLAHAVRAVYIGSGGAAALGGAVATVVRILLAALVLFGPTFLMGGTLPALAREVEHAADDSRRVTAALYGVNTLGAVAGAALATFVLLETFGTRTTLWLACSLNAAVGLLATRVAARAEPRASATTSTDDAPPSGPRWFPPVAAAAVGGAFMLMESVWYRMLAPLLGGSSYTLGLVLAIALAGIGIGGALAAWRRKAATLGAFALTCALEALALAAPFAAGDRIAILALRLRPDGPAFGQRVLGWAIVSAIVVLPAAIVSGIQFPLVIGLYGRGDARVGRDVGRAYLANTIGGIAGSLAGGFGLLPLLGAPGCWRAVVFALCALAALALMLGWRAGDHARRPLVAACFAAVFAIACVRLVGPTAVWRHSGIGAGRAERAAILANTVATEAWIRAEKRAVYWEQDGVESAVAMNKAGGFSFIVNGKSDGSALSDSATQIMGGMVPAIVHGAPHRAMVIGLGSGSTAGWLAAIPAMERVDVVEIEPSMLRVARDCAPVNQHVLDRPNVKIAFGDAREALLVARDRYDVIFSEPSNPFRAGISSLYTREFYTAAKGRLAPRGIFAQWVQGYEIDMRAFEAVLRTMREVFPDVELWTTEANDLLLLAREAAEPLDVARLRTTVAEEPYRSALAVTWRTRGAEGFLSRFVGTTALADDAVARNVRLVTDDDNALEFSFARTVGVRGDVGIALAERAAALHADRPALAGETSWERVEEERWLERVLGGGSLPGLQANRSEKTRAFHRALAAYNDHACDVALAEWKRASRPPPFGLEAMVVAECAARTGDAELYATITPSVDDPAERLFFDAVLASQKNDPKKATDALTRAFVMHREDPWPRYEAVTAGFELVRSVEIMSSRANASAILESLSRPFSVLNLDEGRLDIALLAALATNDPSRCVPILDQLEPWPPWEEDILGQRVSCYRVARDPRLPQAENDLREFKGSP
jgi:spermidine synthase